MIYLRLLGAVEAEDEAGEALWALLRQPKRLTLLACLAVGRQPVGRRRELLLALLWPELSPSRARHALSQSLYYLRRILGEDVIHAATGENVRVRPGSLVVDVDEFEDALARDDWRRALELYRGDFLEGIYANGASHELEEWIESTREQYRNAAAEAAWSLAESASQEGDSAAAAAWARRAAGLTPWQERAWRRLIELLDRAGDRASALAAYEELEERLTEQLEVTPSRETQELVAAIRDRHPTVMPPFQDSLAPSAREEPPPAEQTVSPPAVDGPPPAEQPAGHGWRKRLRQAGTLAAVLVVIAGFWWNGGAHPAALEAGASPPRRTAPPAFTEGLRAFERGELAKARREFEAALEQDSSHALSAYFAARSAVPADFAAANDLLARAVRLSQTGPEWERLLIQASWLDLQDDPALGPLTDSLLRRYPELAEAHFQQGRALLWSGDFVGSTPHFRAAVAQSGVHAARSGACVACDAYEQLVEAYSLMDSLQLADAVAREWVRAHPSLPRAWEILGNVLVRQERYDEARAAYRRMTAVGWSEGGSDLLWPGIEAQLAVGDFDEADWALAERLRNGGAEAEGSARWFSIMSLRYQGRLEEALTLARIHRREGTPDSGAAHPIHSVPEAQVLFELGRYREAAALFDSLAAVPVEWRSRTHTARHRVWMGTHAATALAALGDTAELRRREVELRTVGQSSGFGRDRLLHGYVGALRLAASGDTMAAIAAAREAVFSPTSGYSRLNLLLSDLLLAADSADAARAVASAALRGVLGASNYYATRTELHLRVARAFDRLGQVDSAAVHYRWVEAALHRAEPPASGMRAEACRRLGALGKGCDPSAGR